MDSKLFSILTFFNIIILTKNSPDYIKIENVCKVHGMSYTFICQIESSDSMKVYLKKDDMIIYENFSTIIYPIEYLEAVDTGSYRCIFKYQDKVQQYKIDMIVHDIKPISKVINTKIIVDERPNIILECLTYESMEGSYTSWTGHGLSNCKGKTCYLRTNDIYYNETYSCIWIFEDYEIMRKYFLFQKISPLPVPSIVYFDDHYYRPILVFEHGIIYNQEIEDSIELSCYTQSHRFSYNSTYKSRQFQLRLIYANRKYQCSAVYIYNNQKSFSFKFSLNFTLKPENIEIIDINSEIKTISISLENFKSPGSYLQLSDENSTIIELFKLYNKTKAMTISHRYFKEDKIYHVMIASNYTHEYQISNKISFKFSSKEYTKPRKLNLISDAFDNVTVTWKANVYHYNILYDVRILLCHISANNTIQLKKSCEFFYRTIERKSNTENIYLKLHKLQPNKPYAIYVAHKPTSYRNFSNDSEIFYFYTSGPIIEYLNLETYFSYTRANWKIDRSMSGLVKQIVVEILDGEKVLYQKRLNPDSISVDLEYTRDLPIRMSIKLSVIAIKRGIGEHLVKYEFIKYEICFSAVAVMMAVTIIFLSNMIFVGYATSYFISIHDDSQ